ncbi:MAG: hypothetical protein ABSD57_01335 [Verrucomicrobiota bacterium]|jgi:hypothetical protein
MNPTSPKLDWVRLTSLLGIVLATIALCGGVIILMNWNDLYHLGINGSILNVIVPFTGVAWIGELICGFLILKRRKIIARTLIVIGFFLFVFMQLIPAQS